MIDEDAIRLAVLADHLDEVDYYSLLEIPRDADFDSVRLGFHDFALRFHPDQHLSDPIRQKQALAIFKRGAEAYRVLRHAALRERYDSALLTGALRLPTDAMQLPTDNAVAEPEVPPPARAFYDKAVEAMKRKDFGGARMYLALAIARGDSPAFDKLASEIRSADPKTK